ncbi:MAG: FecR family protein [Candidatus Cyclobacteriaceae bacterium M3_2C_046]
MINKYEKFTALEFAQDDAFIRWVKNPAEADIRFWQTYINQHPDQKDQILEAHKLVLTLQFKEHKVSQETITDNWNRLINQTDISSRSKNRLFPSFKMAAALLILVIAAFITTYYYYNHAVAIQAFETQYRETKKVVLPDGSLVTLNANSKITYHPNWENRNWREVWLHGEAYFDVVKNSKKFIVHTSDLEVEVLGTEFNVKNRRGKIQVVLNSGKVKLDWEEQKLEDQSNFFLKPGEMAEVDQKDNQLRKEKVKTEIYTSWKNNLLIYEESTIADIIKDLEDMYNFQVDVKNPDILSKRFNGRVKADEIELLLLALAETHQLDIKQHQLKITIE